MKNTVGLYYKDFAFSFLLGFPIVSNQTKRKIDRLVFLLLVGMNDFCRIVLNTYLVSVGFSNFFYIFCLK